METNFDSLDIINEVKKWPEIYDREHPDKSNYEVRRSAWNEIATNLIPRWEELTDEQKELKVEEITKKWRNLRDAFRRQVELDKKICLGQNTKKRTPYKYFRKMMFLLPLFADESFFPYFNKYLDEPSKSRKMKGRMKLIKKKPLPQRMETAFLAVDKPEEVQASPQRHRSSDDIDEDKTFLMSLVPCFKRMSEDEKLTAKVEILQVLKSLKRSSTMMVECMTVSDTHVTGSTPPPPRRIKKETDDSNDDDDDPPSVVSDSSD